MADVQTDIRRFLRTGEGDFDALAIKLFTYQYERNRPYHAFCDARGRTPGSVQRWPDIPAVPIGAFKSSELCTFPVGDAAAIFHSSATTSGTPSRHFIKELAYYEASLRRGFATSVLRNAEASPRPILILTPPPAAAPHSSLSWMMDVVKRSWGAAGSDYFIQRGRLDEPRLSRVLRKLETSREPILLLGTTLAFLAYFDYIDAKGDQFHLPDGSQLMDTGGMKTQKRSTTREAFVNLAEQRLGLPAAACINEYGMCELSSQFYGRGRSQQLQGPPWVRSRAIDALTGQDAAAGTPGLLCHYDLANVDSVLAIQTEDLGIRDADGFVFQGRAPEAELKGCSISALQFLP